MPGAFTWLHKKVAIYAFYFRILFFTLKVNRYEFKFISWKNVAPLIWSIPFDSTTTVVLTIVVQSWKRATNGAVGTKRLSLSGNQQVN